MSSPPTLQASSSSSANSPVDIVSICHNPQHSAELLSCLHQYQTSGTLCDVTLEIDGHCFLAHSCVLAACSPLLADTVNDNTKHVVFSTEDISVANLTVMLQYMYTGQITITKQNVYVFLEVARFLGLNFVMEKCQEYINTNNKVSHMTDLNVHVNGEQSSKDRLNDLHSEAGKFIVSEKSGKVSSMDSSKNETFCPGASIDHTVRDADSDSSSQSVILPAFDLAGEKCSHNVIGNELITSEPYPNSSEECVKNNESLAGQETVAPSSGKESSKNMIHKLLKIDTVPVNEEKNDKTLSTNTGIQPMKNVSSTNSVTKPQTRIDKVLRRSSRKHRIILMNKQYFSFDEIQKSRERKTSKTVTNTSVMDISKSAANNENVTTHIVYVPDKILTEPSVLVNEKTTDLLNSDTAETGASHKSENYEESQNRFPITVAKKQTNTGDDNSVVNPPIYCEFCGLPSENQASLESHVNEQHYHDQDSGALICTHCNVNFKNQRSLDRHIKKLHDIPENGKVPCEKCGRMFSTHAIDSHTGRCQVSKTKFKCLVCDKTFKTKTLMLTHHRTHTGEKPYSCDICNAVFTHKYSVTMHKASIHYGQRYPCKICNKTYAQLSTLNHHMRIHNGKQKSLVCTICGKVCTRNFFLKKHMETHHDDNTLFQCSICQQIFLKKSQLSIHLRKHKSGKPFTCEICGDTFSHKYSAKLHMRAHTGDVDQFPCDVCGKVFNRKSNMVKHKVIHNGERPFECTVCGKRFKCKGTMKAHMQIHDGKYRYQCVLCDKRFFKSSGLKSHAKYRHKLDPDDEEVIKKIRLEIEDVQIIDDANIEYIYDDMTNTGVLNDL